MPCHHVLYSVHMSKFESEVSFLLAAFANIGMQVYMRPVPGVAGFKEEGCPAWLWISGLNGREPIGDDVTVLRTHVAVSVKDRSQVDVFHAAALKAGGIDNGAPGLRPEYSSDYYAAFVISPAGHNIECVAHNREETK